VARESQLIRKETFKKENGDDGEEGTIHVPASSSSGQAYLPSS